MKIKHKLGKAFLKLSTLKSQSIFDESWNFLLILDACRYDFFKKTIKKMRIAGTLKPILSKGSDTYQWFSNNFVKRYYDLVYINSNPVVTKASRERNVSFFHLEEVWVDGWDNKLETVKPETVIQRFWEVYFQFPTKRYIIHFLQPHFPFITDPVIGREAIRNLFTPNESKDYLPLTFFKITHWTHYLKYPRKRVLKGYAENLRYVLRAIKSLVKNLQGKIVITADHGEAFGERFLIWEVYGHPKVPAKPLRIVPWFEIYR